MCAQRWHFACHWWCSADDSCFSGTNTLLLTGLTQITFMVDGRPGILLETANLWMTGQLLRHQWWCKMKYKGDNQQIEHPTYRIALKVGELFRRKWLRAAHKCARKTSAMMTNLLSGRFSQSEQKDRWRLRRLCPYPLVLALGRVVDRLPAGGRQ